MIYILLCAYNEEKNIIKLILSLKDTLNKEKYKIIVVDDGSTDNTYDKVKELLNNDIILLRHNKNLGLGFAMKTGFMYIIPGLENNDVVVTMDADNTHPVDIIPFMVKKILNSGYDIVIGSRYTSGGGQVGVKYFRKLISCSAKIILKFFFPYPGVKDYTSGYRAYKGEIIKKLFNVYKENFIQEKDFVVQIELLTKLFTFIPRIIEQPVMLRYDRKYGKSKLKIVKNIFKYLKYIIIFKLHTR